MTESAFYSISQKPLRWLSQETNLLKSSVYPTAKFLGLTHTNSELCKSSYFVVTVQIYSCVHETVYIGRVRLKPDGTRWRMGEEAKGKPANGVGSQYSHTTSECCVSSITNADVYTSAASSRLNWCPCRFKCTRTFRRKTKSGFCTCAITFQTQSKVNPRLTCITNEIM
jgi:hypothetical protein